MIRRLWVVPACALVLAASACKRDTASDTGTIGAGTGTGTAATAVRVEELRLGNSIGADNRVATESSTFRPNETIYASIRTAGSAPSASLAARWTFQDGQVVSEDSRTIAPDGTANTEFHISNPGGWPKGDYKLEVTIDGRPAGSKDFKVE